MKETPKSFSDTASFGAAVTMAAVKFGDGRKTLSYGAKK